MFKTILANLVRTSLKIKCRKGTGAVELLSMPKALDPIPRTSTRKRKTTETRKSRVFDLICTV